MILLLLSCQNDPCANELTELQVPCRVEQASSAAKAGNVEAVATACNALTGPWKEECAFRAGEELGRAGQAQAGLLWCAQAGRFSRFCLTHITWELQPGLSLPTLLEASTHWPIQGEPSRAEVEAHLRAKFWFDQYYGTGTADPTPARNASDADAASARGAWALEAVRLQGPEIAAQAWKTGQVLQGNALPPTERVGRYDPPMPIPGEEQLPHVPTFGGSRRLIGENIDEDIQIAILEGIYFQMKNTGDLFIPALSSTSPRLRYTAFHLYRTVPSTDPIQTLSPYANDPDPVVRAHVADALQHRTWEGKKR